MLDFYSGKLAVEWTEHCCEWLVSLKMGLKPMKIQELAGIPHQQTKIISIEIAIIDLWWPNFSLEKVDGEGETSIGSNHRIVV